MEHEFIDEMLERLLVNEKKDIRKGVRTGYTGTGQNNTGFGTNRKRIPIVCEKHPGANPEYFRQYIKASRPDDYNKCVRCFGWK